LISERSVVPVVGGLGGGLPCVVVLDALDGRTRFIEERPSMREVAVFERINRVLAGFDRPPVAG
jgi:hypothetical protein